MDQILNYGFSEDQLKGVDVGAIAEDLGQKPQKAGMSKSNGIMTPNVFTPESPAAKESRTPIQDFAVRDELGPTSVEVNRHQDLQYRTPQSLSARGDGPLIVAIVGMSCRFPGGASNVEKLQTLVSEGRSAWSEIPESRFNVDAFYHPDSDRTDSVRSRAVFDLAWRNRSNQKL